MDSSKFGKYTCRAENGLGEDQKTTEVSGKKISIFYQYTLDSIQNLNFRLNIQTIFEDKFYREKNQLGQAVAQQNNCCFLEMNFCSTI